MRATLAFDAGNVHYCAEDDDDEALEEVFEDALEPPQPGSKRPKNKQDPKLVNIVAAGRTKASPVTTPSLPIKGGFSRSLAGSKRASKPAPASGRHSGIGDTNSSASSKPKKQWAPSPPEDGGASAALAAISSLMASGDPTNNGDSDDDILSTKADTVTIPAVPVEASVGITHEEDEEDKEDKEPQGRQKDLPAVRTGAAKQSETEQAVDEEEEDDEEADEEEEDEEDYSRFARSRMYADDDYDDDPYGEEA